MKGYKRKSHNIHRPSGDYAQQSYLRTGKKADDGYGCWAVILVISIVMGFLMFLYNSSTIVIAEEESQIEVEKMLQVVDSQNEIKMAENTPQEATRATGDRVIDAIYENFGDRAEDAIRMLKECENKEFSTNVVSGKNGNGTVDVGLFQINIDPKNVEEVEKLKDYKYNIERALKKFKAKNNTFYYWTCGYVVGDYTYVDYLRSR